MENKVQNSLVQNFGARISAIGVYVPERRLTNQDLENIVETTDEWIVKRTGIKERRISEPDEYTSHLCEKAVKDLIERYQVEITDVDFIIVCTSTPDYGFPNVASQLQHRLNIPNAGAVDISATCAGFVYGLIMANGLIASGINKKVLVIGAETLSKITDYTDRTTCILFGDAAGAVLMERAPQTSSFLAFSMGSEGKVGIHLYRTNGMSCKWGDKDLKCNGKIVQNGREVYKWAVNIVSEQLVSMVKKSGLNLNDLDWFIPHSANLRILEAVCERTGFPIEKTLYSLEYYGNTSAATIPLALDMGIKEGKIKIGDHILLFGFGGGLVFAGALLKWI